MEAPDLKNTTTNATPPVTPDPNAEADVLDDENPGTAVARVATEMAAFGGINDNGGQIQLPKFKVMHATSKEAASFNAGDLVLNGDSLILGKDEMAKGARVKLIIFNANIYWKERIDNAAFEAGIRAKEFKTADEVLANGGTIAWKNDVGPTYSEAVTLDILIQKPKGLICSMFGMPFDGEEYAPARMYLDKGAATSVIPEIRRTKFSLAGRGLTSGLFDLWTYLKVSKTNAKHQAWTPILKLASHNSPELVAYIAALLGGREVVAEAEAGE
jgi:hypothetical protein